MKKTFLQAHAANYRAGRTDEIKYIVIHYTANDGDTAEDNQRYFAGASRGASAHFFVDINGWGQSVREGDTAWHCGATTYRHPECRNANSLGIEMCSYIDNGEYAFDIRTIKNAIELVRELAAKYGIDRQHVLRHYDVTGKKCPAPWVDRSDIWETFLNDVFPPAKPEEEKHWYDEAVKWGEDNGIMTGGRPNDPVTRAEAITMLHRMDKRWSGLLSEE